MMAEKVEIRPNRFISVETFSPKTDAQNVMKDVTLFFFHGSMATRLQFADLVEYFKNIVHVVTYDAYGCGASDKPIDSWSGESPYSVQNLFLDAQALFEKYATKQNILIGHSFGSTIAARIFHQYKSTSFIPNKEINGLILIGTAYHMRSGGSPIFLLPLWILERIHPHLSSGFAHRAFSPDVDPILKKKAMISSGKNVMHVVQSFYRNSYWATDDIWQSLQTIPTLIIQGEDDQITTMEKAQELYDKHIQQYNIQINTNPTIINTSNNNDNTTTTTTITTSTSSSSNNDNTEIKSTSNIRKKQSLIVKVPKAGHQVMQEKSDIVIQAIESFMYSILI